MNINQINKDMIDSCHSLGYTGKNIIIAVIDSGVSKRSANNVSGDPDNSYHGSAVASIINSIIPDAEIVSFSVFDNELRATSCMLQPFRDIIKLKKNNPDKFIIVNASWVISFNSKSYRYFEMKRLIRKLNRMGVPVVVSAGNDGSNDLTKYPACWEEPVCVSAINDSGDKAEFSCWHNEVDFCDLGVDVRCKSPSGREIIVSGTSFSTPSITGKLALIAEMFYRDCDRWPSEDELFAIARECCVDIGDDGFDSYFGYGLLYPTLYEFNSNLVEKPVKLTAKVTQFLAKLFGLNKVSAQSTRGITFNRNLKYGMRGSDVLSVKKKLVELGYLSKATHNTFGVDTRRAVKCYQQVKGLEVDGIVGPITWASMFAKDKEDKNPDFDDSILPSHLGSPLRNALSKEIPTLSELRKNFILLAMKYAVDTDNRLDYILGMYRRGGNAINKDLTENIMTPDKLNSYFKNMAYSAYYDNGRKEMMLEASAARDYKLLGCDCSGLVTIIRSLKNSAGKSVVTPGWDATANKIANTYCVQVSDPKPGDLAWRSGHIGIVVSNYGGVIRVAESVGGAYGIQITYYNNRRVYNYVTKKWQRFSAWSGFYRLKCFGDE